MTDVQIRQMVECPELYEHHPNDLVPVSDCQTCKYLRWRLANTVDCKYGEP